MICLPDGFRECLCSLYAVRMTVRELCTHLRQIDGILELAYRKRDRRDSCHRIIGIPVERLEVLAPAPYAHGRGESAFGIPGVHLLKTGYEGTLAVLGIRCDPSGNREGHDSCVSHLGEECDVFSAVSATHAGEHLKLTVRCVLSLVWRRYDVPSYCSQHTIPSSSIAFFLSSALPSWSSPPAA